MYIFKIHYYEYWHSLLFIVFVLLDFKNSTYPVFFRNITIVLLQVCLLSRAPTSPSTLCTTLRPRSTVASSASSWPIAQPRQGLSWVSDALRGWQIQIHILRGGGQGISEKCTGSIYLSKSWHKSGLISHLSNSLYT